MGRTGDQVVSRLEGIKKRGHRLGERRKEMGGGEKEEREGNQREVFLACTKFRDSPKVFPWEDV